MLKAGVTSSPQGRRAIMELVGPKGVLPFVVLNLETIYKVVCTEITHFVSYIQVDDR